MFKGGTLMRKLLGIVVVALVLAITQMNVAIASDTTKTIRCEVVDLACYVTKGAHGPEHKACAIKCINGGTELALLYHNQLYIPVDQDFHSARDQFVPKAGEMVKVTGTFISKGGVNFFQLPADN